MHLHILDGKLTDKLKSIVGLSSPFLYQEKYKLLTVQQLSNQGGEFFMTAICENCSDISFEPDKPTRVRRPGLSNTQGPSSYGVFRRD